LGLTRRLSGGPRRMRCRSWRSRGGRARRVPWPGTCPVNHGGLRDRARGRRANRTVVDKPRLVPGQARERRCLTDGGTGFSIALWILRHRRTGWPGRQHLRSTFASMVICWRRRRPAPLSPARNVTSCGRYCAARRRSCICKAATAWMMSPWCRRGRNAWSESTTARWPSASRSTVRTNSAPPAGT
jgi:hypothetical protein